MSGFIILRGGVVVSLCVALAISFKKNNNDTLQEKKEPETLINIPISEKTIPLNQESEIINEKFSKLIDKTKNEIKTPSTVNHKTLCKNNETIASFKIQNNLYSDAQKAGIPQSVITKIIQLYRKQLNFKSDLRAGNSVDIIYDSDKKLIFSSINTSKKKYEIYGFKKNENHFGYYNSSGICLNNDTFLPPVKNARISSKFGMRIHPVKKIKKRHCGIDFAARTGTPILASESGKVIFIGRKGGYGNCVILKHSHGYKTLYGHMSKYEKKLSKNQNVSKGEVIGYVGKSGLATGPHLHFEVIKHNVRINPEKANFISIEALTEKERKKFKLCKKKMLSKVGSLSKSY